MKKGRKYIEVVFKEAFAGKQPGESAQYEPSLASNLVNRGIAVIADKQTTPVEIPKKEKKPVIKKQIKKKANEKNT